ncbi:hypothetical protein ACF065_29410 [Streptomyces sp. NPDC015232]|uniref:hypothetical protein n=1 Tax=unclassified Streptomyces TaxID=2593676 RepID=UPI0036FC21B8
MFRTMSLLRALIGTSRLVRHTPRLLAALPPDDDVLLDPPDSRLAPALVAAALDDPEPAAKLLATTREAAEWEDRDRYTIRLSTFAYRRDGWLEHWLAAAPADPDALLVKAQLAVRRAWESPARAERLAEVGPLVEAAAAAAPEDPVPWRLALDHARGTHASPAVFETLWEQAVRRAPHHYGSHVAALTYLSAQCCGLRGETPRTPHAAHHECFDFAEQAAEDALPGSLVQALPVRAAFEQLVAGPRAGHPVCGDRIDAAADRALALSARYPAGHLWPGEVRNLLVYVLAARGRWPEALAEFGRIGPHASTFPWSLTAEDPLRGFLDARSRAVREVARRTPLRAARPEPYPAVWGEADGDGRAGPSGHYA